MSSYQRWVDAAKYLAMCVDVASANHEQLAATIQAYPELSGALDWYRKASADHFGLQPDEGEDDDDE